MSNETKRDVFLQLAKENRDLRMYDPETIEPKELIEQDYQDWIREYDAALPDNLPVIPKAVSEHIRWCKGEGGVDNVSNAMDYTYGDVAAWLYDERNSDTFARAWLLGVWRVEETGEIVKLEAEK